MNKENIIIGLVVLVGIIGLYGLKDSPINFGSSYYSYSGGTNSSTTLAAGVAKAITQPGDTQNFGLICNVGTGEAFIHFMNSSTSDGVVAKQGLVLSPTASTTGNACYNATGFVGSLVGISSPGTIISIVKP